MCQSNSLEYLSFVDPRQRNKGKLAKNALDAEYSWTDLVPCIPTSEVRCSGQLCGQIWSAILSIMKGLIHGLHVVAAFTCNPEKHSWVCFYGSYDSLFVQNWSEVEVIHRKTCSENDSIENESYHLARIENDNKETIGLAALCISWQYVSAFFLRKGPIWQFVDILTEMCWSIVA